MPEITARSPLPTQPTSKVGPIQAPAPALDKQPHIPESGTPAPTEATPDAVQPDALSPKFAALARREKALLDEDRRVKAEKQKLDAERDEIKKSAQAEIRARLKQDPYGLMSEEGLTVEKLLELQSNQPSPEAQKLSALEQQLAKIQEEKITEQKRNYESARKQVLTDVSQLVQTSPEFEVLKALGLENQVVDKIEEGFKATGTFMDYAAACKEVEEEYFPLALEIAKLGKIKAALNPAPEVVEEDAKTPPLAQKQTPSSQKQPQATTLSNRQAPTSNKSLTWAEHRARLIAMVEGRAAT